MDITSLLLQSDLPEERLGGSSQQHFHLPIAREKQPQPQAAIRSPLIAEEDLGTDIDEPTRQFMSVWMSEIQFGAEKKKPHIAQLVGGQAATQLEPSLSSFVPTLIDLADAITHELHQNLGRLLALNPSRRIGLALHLIRLAGLPAEEIDDARASQILRHWVHGSRNTGQNAALANYLEEVAQVCLGQALILKGWSDKGIRTWKEEDIAHLNWSLSKALKMHIPVGREGWQITKPNLYSWYNPSPTIQRKIWSALNNWTIEDESPALLAGLLRLSRRSRNGSSVYREMNGYDMRFFGALWENMPAFGFDSEANGLQRSSTVFTPTLRDGSVVRSVPLGTRKTMNWIGLEWNPYYLMVAELTLLWRGPSCPPFWAQGSGIEAYGGEQLKMDWNPARTTVGSYLREMAACDLAFVFEETNICTQARTSLSARLRQQLDNIPNFKAIRTQATTLGCFQACVAIEKVRPGGLMLWAREEPLGPQLGDGVLRFLLDRGVLACEWNLSNIGHRLPVSSPPFPRYLYLFRREKNIEKRNSHIPRLIQVSGSIRSHVEVPTLLKDAIGAYQAVPPPREHWKITARSSPSPQQDWSDHWPSVARADTLRKLEVIKSQSRPLGQLSTVRTVPGKSLAESEAAAVNWIKAVGNNVPKVLVRYLSQNEANHLIAHPLEQPRREDFSERESQFLVLVPDQSWTAPLSAYLESPHVTEWLEHYSEKRRGKWILREQTIKFLPVPNLLKSFLSRTGKTREFLRDEASAWDNASAEKLAGSRSPLVHAYVFCRTSGMLSALSRSHMRLGRIVNATGDVHWRELLRVLPQRDVVSFAQHPEIRTSGALPRHLPVSQITRTLTPAPGCLLATDAGLNLQVHTRNRALADILWNQLSQTKDLTWNELCQCITLPRDLELAQSTASELIRTHAQQFEKKQRLHALLGACRLF